MFDVCITLTRVSFKNIVGSSFFSFCLHLMLVCSLQTHIYTNQLEKVPRHDSPENSSSVKHLKIVKTPTCAQCISSFVWGLVLKWLIAIFFIFVKSESKRSKWFVPACYSQCGSHIFHLLLSNPMFLHYFHIKHL